MYGDVCSMVQMWTIAQVCLGLVSIEITIITTITMAGIGHCSCTCRSILSHVCSMADKHQDNRQQDLPKASLSIQSAIRNMLQCSVSIASAHPNHNPASTWGHYDIRKPLSNLTPYSLCLPSVRYSLSVTCREHSPKTNTPSNVNICPVKLVKAMSLTCNAKKLSAEFV